MNFNEHLNLKGSHAIFGASKCTWLKYDQEQMENSVRSQYRAPLGTEIHEFVAFQIRLNHKVHNIKNLKEGIESYIFYKYFNEDYDDVSDYGKKLIIHLNDLSKETYETIKSYINDGIGYRMKPEQILYFSEYFFGTADTICFRDNFLRIHDLKTGVGPIHIEQLEIYVALFCLEYNIKPGEIEIEIRIYKDGEIIFHKPKADEILPIMDKIVTDNKHLSKFER